MTQQIRWSFAFIILFILSFVPLTEVSAAPELEVKATAGFQNKIKQGEGLPLTLTVVNSGDEFSGDLVIDYSESYSIGSAKAIPFTIGQGETKTINLSLPGLSDEYTYSGTNTQMFYFYEDNWEKGKEIKYKGNKNVRPTFYSPETNLLVTLTESADRLRPFSSMKVNGMSDTQVIHLAQLKDFEFPTDAAAYGMANFLVVDEFVLADLPEDAQKAIQGWMQAGGVVIVGASDNTAAELGLLTSQLPLTLSDERMQIPKKELSAFTNNKEFVGDITAFSATVNEQSRVLLQSGNQPLAAIKSIGKGAIIQTAFSLGDESFSKEANAATLLTELIKRANVGTGQTANMYGYQSVKDQLSYDVGQTNELFPSFQISTPFMVAIVILYIIFVGPLLYFILKRKDKREHAWWIIPAISVLASVAIFAYGAKDRLVRPQIQQSSFYEVQDDGSLSGYYVESLLSNRSGNFTFESEAGTSMVASKRNNAFSGGGTGNTQATSILEEQASKDQLTMRDVGYWSVSSVVGDSHLQNVGKFAIDLTVENGNVRGTVKNEFPFALKEVAIWSGTKMIELGDIDPNESIKVAEPIGSALLLPTASTNSSQYMYGNPISASDLPKERKNSLIRMSQNIGKRPTQPAIIAHTEDAIVPIALKDDRGEMSAVNVVYQPFKPKTIFAGEFTLPSSSFEIAVNAEDPSSHVEQLDEGKFEWIMTNGSYLYEWSIPENVPLNQVNWTELQLANTNTSSITVEIFNESTQTYEEVTSGRFSIKENVKQYISKEGNVQFKVNKQASNGDDYTRLPELRLKGVVQK